jgi:phosphatidate cytidylyltransferase
MTRIITSVIAIPVLIYLIKFAPPFLFFLVSFAAMLFCFYEYYLLVRKGNDLFVYLIALCFASLIFSSFYFTERSFSFYFPLGAVLILIAAVLSGLEIKNALFVTATSLFGAWYVGALTGYVVGVRMIDEGFSDETGSDLLMMLFLIIWCGDTAAYFFGKSFGRHKLSALSPKKTVEGAIAGLVFSILAAVVCRYTFVEQIPMIHAILIGAIVGLAGQLGDLGESLLKRSANVKDSGKVIPGHGGMLDRLDSLLFGAPAMYYYFYLILLK